MTIISPRGEPTSTIVTTTQPVTDTKDTATQVGTQAEASASQTPDPALQAKIAQAKKEKMWRQQQQALKSERDAMRAKLDAFEAAKSMFPAPENYVDKNRLKNDLYNTLTEAGITPDDLTQYFTAAPSAELREIQALKAELQAIKDDQAKFTNQSKERETAQYEQAVNQIRSEVKSLVDISPEFETIKETGSHEAVVELIKATFDNDGTLLTIEEASKQIEDYLIEEAIKMASLKKVKAKLTPAEVAQVMTEATPKQTAQITPRTLTNAVTTTSSKPKNRAERRERALLAGQGLLK